MEIYRGITMKKIASFIPAILWLIISIWNFAEGDLKKGIVFLVCAVGLAVIELIFMGEGINK